MDPFDRDLADSLVGKRVLVGITSLDRDDRPTGQRQFHGVIVRIDPRKGVVVAVHGTGEEVCLPPDLGSYHVAAPGHYRLRSTGEVVVDPDLTCTWTHKPPERQ